MKLEVTKLELIKLKRLLKKYKKQNYKKTNETKLITMGSYSSIDISYLAINRFINEEFFYSLNRAKENIQSIKPIKLIIDNIEYHNIDYDKIDSEIRLTINKLGDINVLESLYQLLNEINIFNKETVPIKSELSNWDSIRKVLKFYKHNIKDYYTILNGLMSYDRIHFNFGRCIEDITYYEPITNKYFIRISDKKTIFRNVILSHEFMHVVLSNKKENSFSSETKPILAEKLCINELIKDNSSIYNNLYLNRINDTFDKICKIKYIYEFLESYNIEKNRITKEKIEAYMIKNNIPISQMLAIFEWFKYDNLVSCLEYIYGDIVSNIMFQTYNGSMSDIGKYYINGNTPKDMISKFKRNNYALEYNNFTKSIKEKIK